MAVEIKHWVTGAVLLTHDGADLSGADLSGLRITEAQVVSFVAALGVIVVKP